MSLIHSSSKQQNSSFLSFSLLLLLSLVLTVISIPNQITWIWPNWMMLLVIYKVITSPASFGIIFGFTIGLLVDLLMGNSLGVHALSYTMICYFINKQQSRFYLAPVLQQAIIVFGFVILDSASKAALTSVIIDWVFIGHSLLSAAATAVLWMLIMGVFGSRVKTTRMR